MPVTISIHQQQSCAEQLTSQEETTTPQPADVGNLTSKRHPTSGGMHNAIAIAQRRRGVHKHKTTPIQISTSCTASEGAT
jgi:hypothetical protein